MLCAVPGKLDLVTYRVNNVRWAQQFPVGEPLTPMFDNPNNVRTFALEEQERSRDYWVPVALDFSKYRMPNLTHLHCEGVRVIGLQHLLDNSPLLIHIGGLDDWGDIPESYLPRLRLCMGLESRCKSVMNYIMDGPNADIRDYGGKTIAELEKEKKKYFARQATRRTIMDS